MPKKEKKISINAFEKAISIQEESKAEFVTWNGLEITVKPSLSLAEMLNFVSDIVTMCFSDEGEYLPEVLDFAIRRSVLIYYSNLKLPSNIENQYPMVCDTDVYEKITESVNTRQLSEIIVAAKEKVAHLKGKPLEDSAKRTLSIVEKVDSLLDILTTFLVEKSKQLDTMGKEDMLSIVEALKYFDPTDRSAEEKVVAAYREALVKEEEAKASSENNLVEFPVEEVVRDEVVSEEGEDDS